MSRKLDRIFSNSKRIKIDNKTKIVIMSDCHRGIGDNHDNFVKNQNIYEAALRYYYKKGYTYIELGDGDDMWEVKDYKDIVYEYLHIFKLLKKYNEKKRLIMIYGNHDIVKRKNKVLKENFYKYYNKITKEEENLLNNLDVYESLILDYNGHDIFMLHGHQINLLNSTLWRLARFLVRHVWRKLERLGLKDPTSAARNYKVTKRIEKRLKKWSMKKNKILIAGHTHRPIFPKVGQSLYFNDGSCIHPNGVTCLEINHGNITLVRWLLKLEKDKLISVGRVVIDGMEPIDSFFSGKF